MNNLVFLVKVIIKQDADRDGSGSMDFQEFVEMMIKVGIEVNFDVVFTYVSRSGDVLHFKK